MITQDLYLHVTDALNEIHQGDPNHTNIDGLRKSSEFLYTNRMLQMLAEFEPGADYTLQIAAQCQHLERWKVARDLFPMDRKGYHQWRKAVMDFQISRTTEVLVNSGVENSDIIEVTEILSKQGNKSHTKAQIIQDVACIVFVNWYLEGFAAKHELGKVKDIVIKTTRKMSEKGMQSLHKSSLPKPVQEILSQLTE